MVLQITETEKLITQKKQMWEDLEKRRVEMETECPDVDFTQYNTVVESSSTTTTTTVTEQHFNYNQPEPQMRANG